MTVVTTVQELRTLLRSRPTPIGFVPTMGALHEGHAQLLRFARSESQSVAASIFVNPLQFDRPEDLARYPRTLEPDLAICREAGVDVVFAPSAAELYPQEQLTFVEVPQLSANLCGAFRPGHFRGVCTVVLKLFHIVQPDRAYFGEKDAQQLAVIRRMVRDLNLPLTVVGVPTVREADGLAMSSRNRHLSPEERALAPRLYASLQLVIAALQQGERLASRLRQLAIDALHGLKLEYFEIVDTETLAPLETITGRALIAVAAWLGSTRLIDNVTWNGRSDGNDSQ